MKGDDRQALPPLERLMALARGGQANLFGLLALLIMLVIVFSMLLPGSFLQVSTVQAMMFQLPELGLLSLAMMVPLVSGGLNLAIIATANQAALLMAWILTTQMPPDAVGVDLWAWIFLALAAGFVHCVIVGIVTGLLISAMNVHPILVTLGTQTLIGGISIWLTRGRTLSGFPELLIHVSNETLLGVPISFILLVVMAIAVHVVLTRTPLGIRIHMIGSNLPATRYSGVNTGRVLIWVYVMSSLLCWLAAILGGIDPYGGFGRVAGLVISLAILQTIASGFNLLGFSQHLTLALWGLTLLLVMAAKRLSWLWHLPLGTAKPISAKTMERQE
jgi:simple sugar transport system permease protein